MRISAVYSHLNGLEWLKVQRKGMWSQIEATIKDIDAEKCRTKVSKEKGKMGTVLYSPAALNAAFKTGLESRGWASSRVDYWVADDADVIRRTLVMSASEQKGAIEATSRCPIKSYNQTDFVKDRVAIEVQFGKYSFIAYDLFVKHLAFYVANKIDCGVEILPMKSLQAQMSSGPGYFEAALYDVVRQGRGVPSVPLVLVGVTPDDPIHPKATKTHAPSKHK